MRPILFSETGWRNHCAAKMTAASALNADPLRQPEPAQQTSEPRVVESSADLNTAGSEPSRRRWRESVKAVSPRQNVVLSAPSASRTGREHRIENMAPESRRPQNVCAMSMDRALREMEFPSRLAGAEWVCDG